jgi:hypothetical protein
LSCLLKLVYSSSIEDPLIQSNTETDEVLSKIFFFQAFCNLFFLCCPQKLIIHLVEFLQNIQFCNVLSLLTFNFVNPIVNIGVTKQLDFQNLIPLPTELNPSSCYDKLQNCWRVEYSARSSDSSLFRVMYYSFGWPYLRLGLLKVFIIFPYVEHL